MKRKFIFVLCFYTIMWHFYTCNAQEKSFVSEWESRSTFNKILFSPINLPCNMSIHTIHWIVSGCIVPFYHPDEWGWSLMFIIGAPINGIEKGIKDTIDGRFFWEASLFDNSNKKGYVFKITI